MKTKHLKLALSFSLLSGTLPAYNNLKRVEGKTQSLTLSSIHEASRLGHAEELLGSQDYKLSDAAQVEQAQDLNKRIFQQIQKSLPPRYKAQTRQITQTLIEESTRYQMDPVFVMAVIKTESLFNPQALGAHGEIGLMQLKPDTAQWIAKKFQLGYVGPETLLSASANIRLGVAYLNFLRGNFKRKAVGYINAYNMGPLNVRKLLAQNIKPSEYKSKVMKNYSNLYYQLADKNEHLIAAN